jgi:sigma54-dependent transcription regulator
MATAVTATPAASAWREASPKTLRSKTGTGNLRAEFHAKRLYELRQSVRQICAQFQEQQQHTLVKHEELNIPKVRLPTVFTGTIAP